MVIAILELNVEVVRTVAMIVLNKKPKAEKCSDLHTTSSHMQQ